MPSGWATRSNAIKITPSKITIKNRTRFNVSQKSGTDTPRKATSVTFWPINEPRRTAEIIPAGTPMLTAKGTARALRSPVGSMCWRMVVVTGRPKKMEVPRSPTRTRWSHRNHCVTSGASSPSSDADA